MAERSGNPKLDALIEAYLQGPLHQQMKVEMLRDPQWAAGACNHEAQAFAEFLRSRGVEAECLSEEGWLAASPDDFGYTDRTIPGFDQHDVTYVDLDGQTYMVDWTAAQYGYQEFPMVQRQAVPGEDKWEREWSS